MPQLFLDANMYGFVIPNSSGQLAELIVYIIPPGYICIVIRSYLFGLKYFPQKYRSHARRELQHTNAKKMKVCIVCLDQYRGIFGRFCEPNASTCKNMFFIFAPTEYGYDWSKYNPHRRGAEFVPLKTVNLKVVPWFTKVYQPYVGLWSIHL